jgi:hypothetical protein
MTSNFSPSRPVPRGQRFNFICFDSVSNKLEFGRVAGRFWRVHQRICTDHKKRVHCVAFRGEIGWSSANGLASAVDWREPAAVGRILEAKRLERAATAAMRCLMIDMVHLPLVLSRASMSPT